MKKRLINVQIKKEIIKFLWTFYSW